MEGSSTRGERLTDVRHLSTKQYRIEEGLLFGVGVGDYVGTSSEGRLSVTLESILFGLSSTEKSRNEVSLATYNDRFEVFPVGCGELSSGY